MSDSKLFDDIELKLSEASLYKSQGLKSDAQDIYLKLLKGLPEEEIALRTKIENELALIQAPENSSTASGTSQGGLRTDDEQFLNCLGLMEAGFYDVAIEELTILLSSYPHPAKIQAKIGECCLCQNKPFEAIEHFEKAVSMNTLSKEEQLTSFDRLATLYENTGSIPAAIKNLEQITKIDRNFHNASQRLNSLAQTSQKSGRYYNLIQNGLITLEDLARARELAKQRNRAIDTILLSDFNIEKSKLGESLSSFYECPYVEFNEQEAGAAPNCIKGIKEHFFRTNNFVPITQESDGTVVVTTDNPRDLVKTDNIKSTLKTSKIKFTVSLQEDINKYIDYFFGKYSFAERQGGNEDVFEQLDFDVDDENDTGEEIGVDAEGVVVQMANKILEDAISIGASDIHIESQTGKSGIQVRFRIDGECQHYRNIPYNYKKSLVSRLKILAKLDISEKRMPQDGKIKFRTRSRKKIELRVATLPTAGGNEDVVMRILASSSAMPLEKAGLLEHNLKRFKKLIEMPYGLIAVVGPTGSGKTTTLHAALRHINRPEKKIWTVEDPVEIVQEGLRQVQVHTKIDLDYARVLKAFLRADPDIIMVGETRDKETATTVIEASLTGHLVLTTLHTNSAPETVTRLIGMGIDPYTFADSLLGVLAQRLVKRLCPACRESYHPDEHDQKALLESYGEHPLQPLAIEAVAGATLYRPKGCPRCKNVGYAGRLGIHELLCSNDELKLIISKNKHVADIREAAMRGGMLTLLQDGILKVMQGDTSFDYARAACIK
jgi:type II secretory ATPase GspE/PulE/Tfp pilus assembly ATPase PilB-like protein